MTAWTDFVKKFYNEKRASNPLYKFKDALMEGAKEYKKGAVPKRGKTYSKKSKKNVSRRMRRR